MKDLNEAFKECFDFSRNIVFFPVRHHSPACALHLLKTINEYAPEAVLIEGPSDSNFLIPYMVKETTVPPFCIYSSYDDKQCRLSDNGGRYRAYYPFLDYSPELAALRECVSKSLPAYFIDMPYGAYLVNSGEKDGASREDDRRYDVNTYTAMLTSKSGCRDFGEFWEKNFELPAFDVSTFDFAKSVFALGRYMRLAEGSASEKNSTAARECFMARKIKNAAEKFKKILVVTGSFHTVGLAGLIKNGTKHNLETYDKSAAACYLMAYTFESSDKRSGYQAGIPFPAFYQKVWENRDKGGAQAYGRAVEYFIIKAARFARDVHSATVPDEISALYMARSLAKLRDKKMPGVYELIDGVRSSFIKGHANLADTCQSDFMIKLLSGMGVGKVFSGDCIPPVVEDFRRLCTKYKIKTSTVVNQETVLDIVKNYSHNMKSRFMHRLEFLDLGFCRLLSGPDYALRRDKNLAREIWEYRYGVNIESALIDLSVYGATVEELCCNILRKNIKDRSTACDISKDIISAQVMGLDGFICENFRRIEDIILRDRNFTSLCGCLDNIVYLSNMRALNEILLSGSKGKQNLLVPDDFSGTEKGGADEIIPFLAGTAFSCAAGEIENVKNAVPEDEHKIGAGLKNLYGLSKERPDWCRGELIREAIGKVTENTFCNGHIYGICLALSYKEGMIGSDEFSIAVGGYLAGCSSDGEQAASFISGLLSAAKEIVFTSDMIINKIDEIIKLLSNEDFLTVLPNLRYAFTSFVPSEVNRLASLIAAKYGAAAEGLYRCTDISAEQMTLGMKADGFATEAMDKWGFRI